MIGLLSIVPLVSALVSAQSREGYPAPVKWTKLIRTERAHEDLHIWSNLEYGMYQTPMWLSVQSEGGATNVTAASYFWKSGLDWLQDVPTTENEIAGKYMAWESAYIDVTVILPRKENVRLTGWLDRKFGCFTDYEKWVAPSFVDQYGVTWPESQLTFDWPKMLLQSLIYRAGEIECSTRTYIRNYSITCLSMEGPLYAPQGFNPWPSEPNCVPANSHATSQLRWSGSDPQFMDLFLENNITQRFEGTLIPPPVKSERAIEYVVEADIEVEEEEAADADDFAN